VLGIDRFVNPQFAEINGERVGADSPEARHRASRQGANHV
jgi:hypothetical protein